MCCPEKRQARPLKDRAQSKGQGARGKGQGARGKGQGAKKVGLSYDNSRRSCRLFHKMSYGTKKKKKLSYFKSKSWFYLSSEAAPCTEVGVIIFKRKIILVTYKECIFW